jgi:hypothetical protein
MRYTTLALTLASIASIASALPARAETPAVAADSAPRERHVAVSFGPILLMTEDVRVLEITTEARIKDKLGLALVLGAGKITQDLPLFLPDESATVIEAGLQARYYLLGSFQRGLQLGADATYMRTAHDYLRAKGDGLRAGPFVGGKYTTGFGLMFEGQLGYAWKVVERSDDRLAGIDIAAQDDEKHSPVLRINLGWSF